MNRSPMVKRLLFLLICALTAFQAGCATKAKVVGPVFFPPAPNPPRVQYLMGISSSEDLAQEKGFSLLVVGKQEEEKITPILKPYGIAVDGPRIYLCDATGGKVLVINLMERTMEPLKGDFGAGKLKRPNNAAVDEEGNLYVVDAQRKEVLLYDADGAFIKAIGQKHLEKPADVVVSSNAIFILDIVSHNVKVFDRLSHQFIREFGKTSSQEDSLALPIGLALHDDRYLYVTNALSGKVMKYDVDGHFISGFGKIGDGFGQFARPRGVTVDREGIVYVVDAAFQVVQMFNDQGRLLMFFGEPGRPVGSMNLPASVVVSYDYLDFFQKMAAPGFILEKVIFVTNQFGRGKLSVYGMGRREGDTPPPMTAPPAADSKPAAATEEKKP